MSSTKIKLNDITINLLIKEEINRFLNEEMSIANEVRDITNELFEIICYKKIYDFNYQFYNIGEFHIICKNVEINNQSDDVSCILNLEKHTININIPKYNGQIITSTLKANIMHEVEHLYQLDRSKFNEYEYDKLYDIAISILINEKSTDREKYFASFIYCCSTREQDAFVNELYAKLIESQKNWDENIEINVFKKSQAYKALMTIRQTVNDLNNLIGQLKTFDEIKPYAKSDKWFVNLGRNAEKRLSSKIRNVIRKSRKDLNTNDLVLKI